MPNNRPAHRRLFHGHGLAHAVRRCTEREDAAQRARVGSVVRTVGVMGLLGWLFVIPPLLFGFLGRWVDRSLGTGIQLTAALLMVGIGVGGWLVWRRIRDAGIFGPEKGSEESKAEGPL